MTDATRKSLFEPLFSDEVLPEDFITIELAQKVFEYFKSCKVFRWSDANNDCEDRANALCILLDEWQIPNYKGWVFSGYFLKKGFGQLTNSWNYHVATLLPVRNNDVVTLYIVDPATSNDLITIEEWASLNTETAYSYYAVKSGNTYIFSPKGVKDSWYKRNKRNYRWTLQGLSGINGVSVIGKAHLRFNKARVRRTEQLFKKLKNEKPSFH